MFQIKQKKNQELGKQAYGKSEKAIQEKTEIEQRVGDQEETDIKEDEEKIIANPVESKNPGRSVSVSRTPSYFEKSKSTLKRKPVGVLEKDYLKKSKNVFHFFSQ